MDTPFISVRGLTKTFRMGGSDIEVLKGIDLDMHSGEAVSLVGASGVGKSTFLHIMGTLDRPSSGTVRYDGVDVFGLDDARLAAFRNSQVGFVFQFHHLLPEFSAMENVLMPSMIKGAPSGEASARAARLLDEVGLSGRHTHRPGELSGGEQQRVAIARALMAEPRVMLADEPTGNLDTKTAEAVFSLLLGINRERGLTLLVVTHNERLSERTDRTVRMVDGLIVGDDRRA